MRQTFLLYWSSLFQLDQPVSEAQDLPVSASLPLELQARATMPYFLHGPWRFKLRSVCLHGRNLTDICLLSPQPDSSPVEAPCFHIFSSNLFGLQSHSHILRMSFPKTQLDHMILLAQRSRNFLPPAIPVPLLFLPRDVIKTKPTLPINPTFPRWRMAASSLLMSQFSESAKWRIFMAERTWA